MPPGRRSTCTNISGHKPRDNAPGKTFNYNTAETNLAGTLLRSAIGNNLATYLSEKIWRPFGMESDAWWVLTEPGGGEFGGCCISATLRDYGRIGLFALNNGKLSDGTEVLAPDWMKESTTPSRRLRRVWILLVAYGRSRVHRHWHIRSGHLHQSRAKRRNRSTQRPTGCRQRRRLGATGCTLRGAD